MAYQEDIENDIITKLTPLMSDNLRIVPLPEVQADYQKSGFVDNVTVMYFDSEYGDSNNPVKSFDKVVQSEKVFIEVTVESKRLRGSSGVYSIWNAVRGLMLGFSPGGCDKLRLLKFGIIPKETKESKWSFVGVFFCTRIEIQQNIEEVYPLITQINFDYESI